MCSYFWECIVTRCYHFLLISFFLFYACLLLKSPLSALSLLLCHTISPKLHSLHVTISANSHHLLPKKLTKNTQTSQQITQKLYDKKPHRHHQIVLCKSYLKPRKKNPLQSHRTPTKKPKNQHRKIPKTSLKITRKYNQKKKNTQKNSFQNPENQS